MYSYQRFRKRMLDWWDQLISYWRLILIGIVLFVVIAFLFQDTIATILGALVDAIFPNQNNFINWGLRNPIGFVLVLASGYLLIFILVALIESQNIRGINFIPDTNEDRLEVIIENKSGEDLHDCKVIFEDVYQDEKSIITEKQLKVLPGEDTLLWKDSEWDEIDIFKDEKSSISLAKYDELKDASFLFTSAGEIELPEGISKLRARLITKDMRNKISEIVFWVVIQFGEDEEETELEETVETNGGEEKSLVEETKVVDETTEDDEEIDLDKLFG